MDIVRAKRIPEGKSFLLKPAEELTTRLLPPFALYENDELVMYCGVLNSSTNPLKKIIREMDFMKSERSTGLKYESRCFGYYPAMGARNFHACRELVVPGIETLYEMGNRAYYAFATSFPEICAENRKRIDDGGIKNAYRIGGTTFTSGIVNKNSALNYHYDRNNLKNSYNMMLVMRRGCTGGNLSLPEFGATVEVEDRTLFIFRARENIHGVTPMKIVRGGYRISIVYFTAERIKKCRAAKKEFENARDIMDKSARKKVGLSH